MMEFIKRLFFGYLEIDTVKIDMLTVWIGLGLLGVIWWLK